MIVRYYALLLTFLGSLKRIINRIPTTKAYAAKMNHALDQEGTAAL